MTIKEYKRIRDGSFMDQLRVLLFRREITKNQENQEGTSNSYSNHRERRRGPIIISCV